MLTLLLLLLLLLFSTCVSRVDNVLVEFGPPSRWKHAAGDSSKVGSVCYLIYR